MIRPDSREEKVYTFIWRLILAGALLIIAVISFLSEFGIHPDEFDVRACLDWGMYHWIWPDMRTTGIGLGDTYSLYGYTKVCNYSPYFLIAGKIARVFRIFMDTLPYFRMPNLLLAVGMMCITMFRIRSKPYVFLGFGICVQAWYIFSYVTADALDFFLAYISILFLADRESVLWKTLDGDETDKKARVTDIVLLGLFYGFILLGKPYYYACLVLTFIVILNSLLKMEPDRRRQRFIRCIAIVSVAVLVWFARFGLDLYYYGTERSEIRAEMAEIYASDDKKPSTPPEASDITWHMASKGYSPADFFEIEEHWFTESFRSFAGSRITVRGETPYYAAMAVLYVLIIIFLGVYMHREHNTGIFIAGIILSFGGVIASIINSYFIDSQPQGRYLLPVILTICYLGSTSTAVWRNRYFRICVTAVAILSVSYFGLFDLRKLIDLAYVRSLVFHF